MKDVVETLREQTLGRTGSRRDYLEALGTRLKEKGCSREAVSRILRDENAGFSVPLWIVEVTQIVRLVFGSEA